MRRDQWQELWARLDAAWPSASSSAARADLYYEILADLDGEVVRRAVEQLLRENRESLPPAGVVRARSLAMSASPAQPTAPQTATPPPAVGAPSPAAPHPGAGAPGRADPAPAAVALPGAGFRLPRIVPLVAVAIALSVTGAGLAVAAGFAAVRPYERCERARAVVDRTGEPIEGEHECLVEERNLGPFTDQWLPFYAGGAGAALAGAVVLWVGWRRPRWLADELVGT